MEYDFFYPNRGKLMATLLKAQEKQKNSICKSHKVDNWRFLLNQQYETKKNSNISNKELATRWQLFVSDGHMWERKEK